MRKALFLICLLGIPLASRAQSDQASWANLSTLRTGQKIQIVEMNSKKHTGTFVNVSATAISYSQVTGEQAIQRSDVRSVRMERKRRLRTTLLAAGVGAGAGAGVGAAAWESHGFAGGKATGAAVCAGLGFLIGAAVGAALPTHNMIYRVASH
jgi:hypothetical protein